MSLFSIGTMQGRLLPSEDGRIQGFPVMTWRDEFSRAKESGLSFIEWIYELPNCSDNPITSESGIEEIKRLSTRSGIGVNSICADYFMEDCLIGANGENRQSAIRHLQWLLRQSKQMEVVSLVLPFVDSSRVVGQRGVLGLVDLLNQLEGFIIETEVEVHLEVDLEPKRLRYLLEKVPNSMVRIVYDIGNSASLGYDPSEELSVIGSRLGGVHVKDRDLGGGSVPLGQGAADFKTVFGFLREIEYARTFTLQAARVANVDEVNLARQNADFVFQSMNNCTES